MNFEDYFPIKQYIDHANKGLGQHFLIDKNILEKISNYLDVFQRDLVEIGGGIGNLTIYLYNKTPQSYTIIEKDEFYVNHLKTLFPNINVIYDDCLNYTNQTDVIIGNLPYNVATKFLMNIMINNQFNDGIFMIQREVAERIVAKPRSKSYGLLSVLTQCLADAKILFNVSANSFYPKPNVISSVIHLKSNGKIIHKSFIPFLQKIFQHRRKKYHNNLCPDQISPDIYESLFLQSL